MIPITIDINEYPEPIRSYLRGAKLYDCSFSENAKVIYIDKDKGYFLKTGIIADLDREYEMTRFFHGKGLAARVVKYIFDIGHDYLLTEKLPGKNCLAAEYLEQPERLCDTLAEILAMLHSQDCSGCPVPNHAERYLLRAEQNYLSGHFNTILLPDNLGCPTPDDAYEFIKSKGHLLRTDTLIHGDYCLPNVILDDWRFSGFVDLDCGGIGDRHVDIFWGTWSLFFNFKTDKYRRRFYDTYGRDRIDEERLRLIAAIEVFG